MSSPATTATTTAVVRLPEMSRAMTKTVAGTALSKMPRPPPSASTKVVAETSRPCPAPSASGTGGAQLVRRVVDRLAAVLAGQPTTRDELAARVDAADA